MIKFWYWDGRYETLRDCLAGQKYIYNIYNYSYPVKEKQKIPVTDAYAAVFF